MNYKKILKQVKSKVTSDFEKAPNPGLFFHTLTHTKKVASRAHKIGKHYQLEHEPFFILLTAAWFHDIGYLYGKSAGHENRGAEIAGAYLTGEGLDSHLIEAVKNSITSAGLHNNTNDILAQILCDADLYHLGTKGFFSQNKLVKKEREWESGQKIPKEDWINQTIEFLESHHFQTAYCEEKLEKRKQKNIRKIKDRLQALVEGETNAEKGIKLVPEKKKLTPKQSVLKEE